MKKLLSLVLVLAVVLSSMSFAFAAAPSDTAGNKFESSILKLMSLGIVNGYTDGTYKPDAKVTRAEFAKLMCVALGYNEAATAAKNTVVFSDVPTSHWASGYVAVAFQNEIIKGVGNGKFNPDADVTYEQVVTIVMRSLGKGYDKMADTMGGYPVGYLSIASQKEITKGSDGQPGVAANRALVAKIIDNALDKEWMNMTASKITSDGKVEWTFATSTDTMLTKGLHLKKYEGQVVDSVNTTDSKITFTADVDGKKVYSAASPISVAGLKNCALNVWVKDGVIYSLENKTTIKFDKLEKINGTDSATNSDVNGKAQSTLTKIELKNDGGVYYPKTVVNSGSTVNDVKFQNNFDDSSATLDAFVSKMAKVFINSDNKVYRVEAFTGLGNVGLIAEATAAKIKYQKFDTNDVYLGNLDKATDELYVFIDGKIATIADVKAGMYFESFVNGDGKKVIIAASSKTATGKLSTFETDKAKIAGTVYDTATDKNYGGAGSTKYASLNEGTKFDTDKLDDLVGVDVTAYMNLIGKIAFIKGKSTSSTNDFYGLVKSFAQESKTITVIKNVDGVSTEVTYSVKTDTDELADADDAIDETPGGAAGNADGVGDFTENAAPNKPGMSWNAFLNKIKNEGSAGNDLTTNDDDAAQNRIYKFYVNSDNKITRIDPFNTAVWNPIAAAGTNDFDKDNGIVTNGGAFGTGKFYADGAVYFDLIANKVRYWSEIKDKTATGAAMHVLENGTNDQKAEVVAFTNNTYRLVNATDYFYAFVTGEEFDGTYYQIATSDATTLKLHKDDATAAAVIKTMKNKFLTYTKEGEKIKVAAVNQAVYDDSDAALANSTVYDYDDGIAATTPFVGTFVSRDGYDITTNVTTYRCATDVKVIRITTKSGVLPTTDEHDIDTANISDITSIDANDQLLLVQRGELIRAIYYISR